MEKKLTSRDKQALATKNKIYQVGIKLIQKHGLDGINVTQIARASGVSVGTFYHYYKSKLDLFMDLYRAADSYFETELVNTLRKLPYPENIYLFFEEYADMAEKNGVKLTQKMYIPENSLFISRQKGMHSVLKELIEDAKRNGLCDTEKAADDMESELFLIARGVIFDWALHEDSYALKDKMKKMLTVYIKTL